MVQASIESEICLHKNSKRELKKEVYDNKIPGKEVAGQKEISCKIPSKKKLPKKRKPSLCITFHNPNSEEATASFLTKVLAERLAEEIGKGSCK